MKTATLAGAAAQQAVGKCVAGLYRPFLRIFASGFHLRGNHAGRLGMHARCLRVSFFRCSYSFLRCGKAVERGDKRLKHGVKADDLCVFPFGSFRFLFCTYQEK